MARTGLSVPHCTGWKPVPRKSWLGQSCPSPNARTRLSVPHCTGWKPVPRKSWLGQSCPSPNARTRLSVLRLHGLEARATRGHRQDTDTIGLLE
ncbi:MAG: hypothetical protein NZ556_09465, partial [Fimbriimonadales bacterium]|nr:hypothetical protein [Fimbriimonadales bacterium]